METVVSLSRACASNLLSSSKSIQTTTGHVFNVIMLIYRLKLVHMYLIIKQTILEAELFNSVVYPTSHMAALSWQFARNTTPH